MKFKEYIELARRTATYPQQLASTYLIFGLTEEIGEVLGKFKKLIRDDGWNPDVDPYGETISDEKRKAILLELGDVMWYIANIYWENQPDEPELLEKDLDLDKSNFNYNFYMKKGLVFNLKALNDTLNTFYFLNYRSLMQMIAIIAGILGSNLEEVCRMNIKKLQDRLERNTIHGSGDYR